jgi:hypothetical protein
VLGISLLRQGFSNFVSREYIFFLLSDSMEISFCFSFCQPVYCCDLLDSDVGNAISNLWEGP